MREKPFEAMESLDSGIRQKFREVHKGREPDNFVESGEGGGVDGDQLAKETPTEEQRFICDLDTLLEEYGSGGESARASQVD